MPRTGHTNRSYFQVSLQRVLAEANQNGETFAFSVSIWDRFKQINDRFRQFIAICPGLVLVDKGLFHT